MFESIQIRHGAKIKTGNSRFSDSINFHTWDLFEVAAESVDGKVIFDSNGGNKNIGRGQIETFLF